MKGKFEIVVIVIMVLTMASLAVPVLADDYGIGQYRGSWGAKPVQGVKPVEPVKQQDLGSWPELQSSRGSWMDKLLAALGKWFGADDWGKGKKDDSMKVKTLDDKQMIQAKPEQKSAPVGKGWEQFMEGGSRYPGASTKMQGAQRADTVQRSPAPAPSPAKK